MDGIVRETPATASAECPRFTNDVECSPFEFSNNYSFDVTPSSCCRPTNEWWFTHAHLSPSPPPPPSPPVPLPSSSSPETSSPRCRVVRRVVEVCVRHAEGRFCVSLQSNYPCHVIKCCQAWLNSAYDFG